MLRRRKQNLRLKTPFYNDILKFFAFIAIMLSAVLFAAILSQSCEIRASEAPESATSAASLKEVREYISWFHRNTGRHMASKKRFAKEHIAPVVVRESVARGVDPLLTAVIISLESSWRLGRSGGKGELGLMQVMNPRYEPKTFEDEIILGTEILAKAVKTCATTLGALTWYASGSCKPRTDVTRKKMNYRYRLYRQAVKRARE